MIPKRSGNWVKAWAIVENNKRNALALFSGEVPIYWLRKVAQERANKYNNGGDYVRVEEVIIHRIERNYKQFATAANVLRGKNYGDTGE